MATRVNLCPNPCLTNNNTGWGGGSTPTRTDVSGLGFDRQFAARYTAGSFILSPVAAATPGLVYTVSAYARPENFDLNGTVWIEFLDSGGSTISEVTATFSAPLGAVTRFGVSGTAPTGAVGVQLVVTGENYASNAVSYTQCLMEQSSTLGDYFDGDTSGATWDGTPGNSTSTLSDAPAAVTGDIDGTLPSLTGALTADVITEGDAGGTLPALSGSLSATVTADGDLAGTLPALTGAFAGDVQDQGTLAGVLPALGGTVTGEVFDAATLTGALPALTGDVSATVINPGTLGANLPALTGDLSATVTNPATLNAALPALTGSLSSTTPDEATLAGAFPALTGSLTGDVVAGATLAGTLPALTGSLTGGVPGVVEAIRVEVSGPAVPDLVNGPVLAVGADPSGPAARRDVSGPAVRRAVDGVGV